MKTLRFIISGLLLIVLLPGCASIVTKTVYPVNINTTPSAAEVTVSNKYGQVVANGTTPFVASLKSSDGFFVKASYILTFHKEGYQDTTVPLNATIDGWYFGNLLLGGVIGMLIIDPATGAMWRMEADYINVTLAPKAIGSLRVMDINEVSDEMKEKMIPIDLSAE